MFSNKENVNILTGFFEHGVSDVVVCPGSRNAPIVHNLHALAQYKEEHGLAKLHLHSVTDERSAAFVAIGLHLASRLPVVVCVTSGSALLNLLPGVAEAAMRQIPLIVISADRPPEMIGQLDGQTIPQLGALQPYAKSWQIPEVCSLADKSRDEAIRHIKSICTEALRPMWQSGQGPVHINVPITEPLFEFSTPDFTHVLPLDTCQASPSPIPADILDFILSARHPALIIGQNDHGLTSLAQELAKYGWTIFAENLSNALIFNDTLPSHGIDLLLHVGGCLVEKRLKLQLRQMTDLPIIRIDTTDECPATFGPVTYKVKGSFHSALRQIINESAARSLTLATSLPEYVKHGQMLKAMPATTIFLGNSTAVRWANRHFQRCVPYYCNRGINGIEGSLSAAAGYHLATSRKNHDSHSEPHHTICILGDLSFFYDCNALWQRELNDCFHVIVVNNHRGGIFSQLPGCSASPAFDDFIAARHDCSIRGIVEAYHCTYLSATTSCLADDIDALLEQMKQTPSQRPIIIEVLVSTDSASSDNPQ